MLLDSWIARVGVHVCLMPVVNFLFHTILSPCTLNEPIRLIFIHPKLLSPCLSMLKFFLSIFLGDS